MRLRTPRRVAVLTPSAIGLVLGITLIASAPAFGQAITRGPFIQNPDALTTTATLEWWTDVSGDSTVQYGTTMALGSTVNVPTAGSCDVGSAGTCHIVPLTGLSPGTRYFYQLITNGVIVQPVSSSIYFTTLKDPTDTNDLFFTMIGDFGAGSSSEQQIANLQDAADPPLLITVGDNAYEFGSQSDWDSNVLPQYRNLLKRATFFPILGNHDVNQTPSTWASTAEIKMFLLPRNGAQVERYYSFDSGDAHFTMLDANIPTDSTQRAWLDNDLATTTRKWKFVFLHQTPYSCASGLFSIGSDTSVRNNWGPLFEKYGVDVVFDGHDHIYERSKYVDDFLVSGSSGSDGLGTYYVMTGGGGQTLDGAAQISGGQPVRGSVCYWLANGCSGGSGSFCSFSRFEYVSVHVTNDTTLQLQGIDNNGNIFDTFTITKNTGPTATPTATPVPPDTPTSTPTDTVGPPPTATPTNTPPPTSTATATPTAADCTDQVPTNPCVPGGGSAKTECALEWRVPSAPQFLNHSIPINKVYCTEGTSVCDFDPDLTNHSCTFHVRLCINNQDPRFPSCTPSNVATFEVVRPKPVSTAPADIANRTALQNQAGSGPGGFGVSVPPAPGGSPNAMLNLCSGDLPIVVPLKQRGGSFSAGHTTLRVRATTSAGKRDTDTLKLECRPAL